jgi:hypothetical protein
MEALSQYKVNSTSDLVAVVGLTERVELYRGVGFVGRVLEEDFISAGVEMLRGGLFPVERYSFNCAILNPPYKKIRSDSRHRRLLSNIGIETGNLYSAFLAIVVDLLESGSLGSTWDEC